MASLKAISTAIESIDSKKENLRKVFEDFQAHSSSIASFALQWKDLEDHFDSIKSSIEERFKDLESKESKACLGSAVKESLLLGSSNGKLIQVKEEESEITPPPELVLSCSKMDWKGLRSYVSGHRKVLHLIREEVAIALKSASDPAKLVLDAILGLYPPSKGNKDAHLSAVKSCIFLLEQQTAISPQIKPNLKEKAMKLAVEWKGKVSSGNEDPLEILACLQLIATYDLVSDFDEDELLDLVVDVARRRQAIDMCRALGFTDKMPDFIQKLNSKGKHIEAVKFIFAFELADKFPPVPLLKTYVKESKKIVHEIRKKGNDSIQSQNEASSREVTALKAVIRLVEEHDLESQYPLESLHKRIEQLEKQKADRKRAAASPANNKQQSGNKRPRQSASAAAAAVVPKTMPGSSSTVPQTQLQPSSMLPDRVAPYYGSASGPYGLAGHSSASPYLRTSSELYGVSANPLSFGGHQSPARSHLYPSDSHPSGLYDRPLSYGGYGLPPQYHSSFYP